MKENLLATHSVSSFLRLVCFCLLGMGACSAAANSVEAWNKSVVQTYPITSHSAIVAGDLGTWSIYSSSSSNPSCIVESISGNKRLKLQSATGSSHTSASLQLGITGQPRIALSAGMRFAVKLTGSLTNATSTSFPGVFPPACDNFDIYFQDANLNVLVYIFQRSFSYQAHNTTLTYVNSSGQTFQGGYREVFVDTASASGGSYVLDLYNDFVKVAGFNPVGSSIEFIRMNLEGEGMETIDDFTIGTVAGILPSITLQPQSQIVALDSSFNLFVKAAGTDPLNFQWFKDGTILPYAVSSNYSVTLAAGLDSGSYRVIITNLFGSITSAPANIVVQGPPTLVTEPLDRSVTAGNLLFLTTSATGVSPLSFQWYKDGSRITGAATNTLSISNVQTTSSGSYWAVVANDFGSTTTRQASVNVSPDVFTFSTLAGSGVAGSTDGLKSEARFNRPRGITVDDNGTVFVADTANHIIRKIASNGMVTVVAGYPGSFGSNNGSGTNARFNSPRGIAVDYSGNLFVADTGNNLIRKIAVDKTVSTLAGWPGLYNNYSIDGTGTVARFSSPEGVTIGFDGTLFVADTAGYTIRKVTSAGVVTTIAGSGGPGNYDSQGPWSEFDYPYGVAVDGLSQTAYVTDGNNNSIRSQSPDGMTTPWLAIVLMDTLME